jgi:hypothetical protein
MVLGPRGLARNNGVRRIAEHQMLMAVLSTQSWTQSLASIPFNINSIFTMYSRFYGVISEFALSGCLEWTHLHITSSSRSHCGAQGWYLSFMIIFTAGRTPWTGDQPVARPLPLHRAKQTQNEHTHTQTSMPWVGLDPTILASERAKTVHASDRSATVTGTPLIALK